MLKSRSMLMESGHWSEVVLEDIQQIIIIMQRLLLQVQQKKMYYIELVALTMLT